MSYSELLELPMRCSEDSSHRRSRNRRNRHVRRIPEKYRHPFSGRLRRATICSNLSDTSRRTDPMISGCQKNRKARPLKTLPSERECTGCTGKTGKTECKTEGHRLRTSHKNNHAYRGYFLIADFSILKMRYAKYFQVWVTKSRFFGQTTISPPNLDLKSVTPWRW